MGGQFSDSLFLERQKQSVRITDERMTFNITLQEVLTLCLSI